MEEIKALSVLSKNYHKYQEDAQYIIKYYNCF